MWWWEGSRVQGCGDGGEGGCVCEAVGGATYQYPQDGVAAHELQFFTSSQYGWSTSSLNEEHIVEATESAVSTAIVVMARSEAPRRRMRDIRIVPR